MKLAFVIPNEYVQKSTIFLPPTLELTKFPSLSFLFLKNPSNTFYSDKYYIVYYEEYSYVNIFKKEELIKGEPIATFDFNGRFYLVYKKDKLNKYFRHVYKHIYNVVDGIVISRYSAINREVQEMIVEYYHNYNNTTIYKEAINRMFYKIFNPERYYDELAELLSYDKPNGELMYHIRKNKEYYSALNVKKETAILPDKYIDIIINSDNDKIINKNETTKLIF